MAHQLLGRPIQSTYLFVSHVKSLFWHSPPLLSPRFFLNLTYSKHYLPHTPSQSSYRSFLCTATSQPAAALIKDQQQKQLQLPFENEDYEDDTDCEEEDENFSDEENDSSDDIKENDQVASPLEQKQSTHASKVPSRRIPQLTPKEKKQLNSYAHGLGKKLKCHQVGKSGVTSSLETSVSDALEANELIKILDSYNVQPISHGMEHSIPTLTLMMVNPLDLLKVHGTCPGEPDAVASQLQEATRSVVVGQIGRTFILYRPSPHKAARTETKKPSPRPQKQQRYGTAKPAGLKKRKA